MDDDVRDIFYDSSYWRMAAIAVISSCMLCCIPQSASCHINASEPQEILNLGNSSPDYLATKFDNLEQSVNRSDNPLKESKKFLQSFLNEIESRHGINLTIQEACLLVKNNLHLIEISEESLEPLLITIDLLLEETVYSNGEHKRLGMGNTIQKSWDYLRGKHKKSGHRRVARLDPNVELPGNVYVGGVEMLSGVLVCLLPFPGAATLGVFMLGDGLRRVADGYIQANDEERLRRQFPNEPR
jgi:hypothetical protein